MRCLKFRCTKTPFFLAILTLAVTQFGRADTVTDTSLDVTYTATSTFTAGTGNTYDVFLKIDPSSFSQGTGFLTAIDMAFKTGSDVSTSVTLVAAPGGISAWSTEKVAGLNSGGCAKATSSGDICFQNLTASTGIPGGPYYFEFAVTMPGTDALTASSDIKAAYNAAMDNSGKNLGLTSMGIGIQTCTAGGANCGGNAGVVPEPSSVLLLGTAGLSILLLSLKRRFGSTKQS